MFCRRGRAVLGVVSFAILAANGVEAQAAELALRAERVVILKDGHALFVKRGAAKADANGCITTGDVPENAVLGTVWAVGEATSLRGMRSGWVEHAVTTETRARTLAEVLAANAGREVTLTLTNQTTVTGTLVPTAEQEAQTASALARGAETDTGDLDLRDPYTMSMAISARSIPPPARASLAPPSVVFLQESTGPDAHAGGRSRALRIEDIAAVDGVSLSPLRLSREQVRRKQLTFDFGRAAAGTSQTVTLMYVAPGLRWVPSYQLANAGSATNFLFDYQAELINEAESFYGAELVVMAGESNIRFREDVSPLSLDATVRRVASAVSPRFAGQQMLQSQMLSNTAFMSSPSADDGDRGAAARELPGELSGESGGQHAAGGMTPLALGRHTLAKGERAAISVLTGQRLFAMPRHAYTFDVSRKRTAESSQIANASAADEARPIATQRNAVFGVLETTNTTERGWSAGPVLVRLGSGGFLQELLTYTPPGRSAQIPLTIDVNVRGEHTEREISREPNALVWYSTHLVRIRKQGSVVVENRSSTDTIVLVTAKIGGRVTRASDGGEVVLTEADGRLFENAVAPNNDSRVTWRVPLAVGERRVVTYDCEYFAN